MVVREKGIHAVEDYLFARYSMYLQVYHHKKTLAADRMFVALMQRVRDLLGRETVEPNLSMWLRDMDKVSVESFLAVDDVTLTYHFKLWGKQAKDSICRDLADRLMQRRLFKARKYSPEAEAVVRRNMAPEVARFYCLHGDSREFPYHDRRQPVLVERGGEILEMSQASAVAQALLNKRRELDVDWLFAPPESIDVLD
jgi:hypothetical protein